MNKHVAKGWVRRLSGGMGAGRFAIAARIFVVAGIAGITVLALTQHVHAVQSASAYCSQYSGAQQTACNDGIRGADCSDYAVIYDQATADICTAAQQAANNGLVTQGSTSPSPTTSTTSSPSTSPTSSTSPSPSTVPSTVPSITSPTAYQTDILAACASYSSNTAQELSCLYGGLGQNGTATQPSSLSDCLTSTAIGADANNQAACAAGVTAGQTYQALQGTNPSSLLNASALLDQLDQSNTLSQYINVLHSSGPDANVNVSSSADNNYSSYVNGAGKQQSIKVLPCASGAAINAANAANSALNPSTSDALTSITKALTALTSAGSSTAGLAGGLTNSNNTSALTTIINALAALNPSGTSGSTVGSIPGSTTGSGVSSTSADQALSTIISALSSADSVSNGNTNPLSGLSGLTGLSGLSGVSGLSGLSGLSGISGLSGLSGLGGVSGLPGFSTAPAGTGTTSPMSTTSAMQVLTQALTGGSPTSALAAGLGSSGGGSTCPAIVWFNGGGWHADDHTSDSLATGGSIKNAQQSTDPGAEDNGPPPGGGANARGYTVIEVTYRLGSDGVYYMYEDVMRGLQHVINNARLYGIDPTKIAVGGDSAGGSLAMRVVASGVSGAKVGIGWSAPTNAFTALFKSFQSFLIGMDHSTCIPTDLAGLDNFTNLLTGGSGNVAQEGQGLSSNDFSGLGLGQGLSGIPSGGDLQGLQSDLTDPISTVTEILQAAQYAADTGQNLETISQQLESAYGSGSSGSSTSGSTSSTSSSSLLSGLSSTSLGGSGGGSSSLTSGVFNLSAKKLSECFDNFKVLSPALFASPNTPPVYMVDFDDDDIIDQQQSFDMRDKVRSFGSQADSYMIKGDASDGNHGLFDVTKNHLGYDSRAVCPTLNFVDSIINVGKGTPNCTDPASKVSTNGNGAGTGGSSGGGGGGGSSSSSGGSGSNSGSGSGGGGGSGGSGNTSGNADSPCYAGDTRPQCAGLAPSNGTGLSGSDCAAVGLVSDGNGGCTFPNSGGAFGPPSPEAQCGAAFCPTSGGGNFNDGILIDTSGASG
jgi:hypothetical protein